MKQEPQVSINVSHAVNLDWNLMFANYVINVQLISISINPLKTSWVLMTYILATLNISGVEEQEPSVQVLKILI